MKNIKCVKCGGKVNIKGEYFAIENEKSRRHGEVIFCKECGVILSNAEDMIKIGKKIVTEFMIISEKIWETKFKN